MKTLRLLATIPVGLYLAIMALRFTSLSIMLVRERMSPYAPNVPAAYFTSFIAAMVSGIALWAMWTKRWRTSPRDA